MPDSAEKKAFCDKKGSCPAGGYWGRLVLVLALASFAAGACPQADLHVSGWFFTPGEGPQQGFLRSETLDDLRHTLPWLVLFCIVYPAALAVRKLVPWRAPLFVALTYALGPGLLVNGLLKENYGRARPNQVEQFGGHAHFTGALIPSEQCAHNCSFTAGDPSVGFALIAFALIWPGRRLPLTLLALAVGFGFGAVRIAQGGHFLSDVLFSGVFTVLSALFAYRLCYKTPGLDKAASKIAGLFQRR